ncbi:endonuclease/exonuclease/phosphatase family protein [Bacillus tuaregi]|uniref:endonuclease/exonuclease/phosphatase family protein n=1 Tax=Bacillus tuaregi TaxID=1816695 RepID=UPI000B189D91|nr:endonuclease/exonuclease/phosphatase family protein [Bacillus tuaregi]
MDEKFKDCDCEGDSLSSADDLNDQKRKDTISFMTWNLFIGADLSPLFSASILEEVPRRVTEVYRQFLATNFPERVKKIAQQIELYTPDVIGLQEAACWQLRQLTVPEMPAVTFDYIKLLIKELENRGLIYEVSACNHNISAQLRSSQGNFIRLLDRDTILIRKESGLKIVKRREGNFKTNDTTKLGGLNFELLRGWSAVDISNDKHKFRVITTHLETGSPVINLVQGNELLEGPANTSLPIIMLGDLNVTRDGQSPSAAYSHFLHAGFQDVWLVAGQGQGLTCCQDYDLLNAFSTLSRRMDCILYKNGWKPLSVKTFGTELQDRTPIAQWLSDHAGVIAHMEV